MRKTSTILIYASLIIICNLPVIANGDTFPGKHWGIAESPEAMGYCSEQLTTARKYADSINTAAVVIIVDGLILDQWGEVEHKFMTHSLRKSVLSAMFGKYVMNGTIDIDMTVGELNIDDEPPLTDLEKTATLRDCLKARSGIYHDALYESQTMKDLKPTGFEVKPGTFWYYNNWDFNALGTIFEQLSGKTIFDAMEEDIAIPIGMEHFEADDGWYVTGEESIHPAYPFNISALDLARFGLLMLRQGRWAEQEIIPSAWVDESTRYHSDATLYSRDGYGYMWWVVSNHNKYAHLPGIRLPEGTYSANGAGGHHVLIIPEFDMVLVHRVNTFLPNNRVSSTEFGQLVELILNARIDHP